MFRLLNYSKTAFGVHFCHILAPILPYKIAAQDLRAMILVLKESP